MNTVTNSQFVIKNRRQAFQIGLAAAASGFLVGCDKLTEMAGGKKPQFVSIDITGAAFAKSFSLPDVDGKLRGLPDFAGQCVVVFFGFVQCPDVCPTTLADLAQVKKLLGPKGDKLSVIFITVDPERDTSTVLKAYMANFDPGFIALVPSTEQLAVVAKEFKVFYKKVEGKTPTSYSMDHTANGYVFDPQGKVRLVARHGMGPAALAGDIAQLM